MPPPTIKLWPAHRSLVRHMLKCGAFTTAEFSQAWVAQVYKITGHSVWCVLQHTYGEGWARSLLVRMPDLVQEESPDCWEGAKLGALS
jgi:hypothetical protein